MSIGDKFLSNKSTTSKRKLEALVHTVLDFLCKSSVKQGKAKVSDGSFSQACTFFVSTKALNLSYLHFFVYVWQVSNANPEAVTRRCDPESSHQHDRSSSQEAAKPCVLSAKRSPDPGRLLPFVIFFLLQHGLCVVVLLCFFSICNLDYAAIFCSVTPDCSSSSEISLQFLALTFLKRGISGAVVCVNKKIK